MDMIAQVNIQTVGQASTFLTLNSAAATTTAMTTEAPIQAPFLSDLSDCQLDRFSFPSPTEKKYRAGSKTTTMSRKLVKWTKTMILMNSWIVKHQHNLLPKQRRPQKRP
jgi:hypothetical protein